MFRTKTIFIVGAGASYEFGLPVGYGLAKIIASMFPFVFNGYELAGGDQKLWSILTKDEKDNGIRQSYYDAASIIGDGVLFSNSIDNFIDMHRENEFVSLVGKTAIVKSIIDAEKASRLYYSRNEQQSFPVEQNIDTWLMRLFRILQVGVSSDNIEDIFLNVGFITFNYDRTIEFFMQNALERAYNLSRVEASTIAKTLMIKHPYGSVGELPLLGVPEYNGNFIPFGGGQRGYDLKDSAQNIRTFTEQIQEGDDLQAMRSFVGDAERIVFLGFAYHRQNVELLAPMRLEQGQTREKGRSIIGTAYGISASEIDIIRGQIGHWTEIYPGRESELILSNCTAAELFDLYGRRISS